MRDDPFDAIRRGELDRFHEITSNDLRPRDPQRRSLLFFAILWGRTELVRRLIAAGASVDPRSRNRPREAKLLLTAGARPMLARDRDGDPVLVAAALHERTGIVRALLEVPHTRAVKSLALIEAAGVGNLSIAKLLVKHGADPTWTSPQGKSAIAVARSKRRADIVRWLASL